MASGVPHARLTDRELAVVAAACNRWEADEWDPSEFESESAMERAQEDLARAITKLGAQIWSREQQRMRKDAKMKAINK